MQVGFAIHFMTKKLPLVSLGGPVHLVATQRLVAEDVASQEILGTHPQISVQCQRLVVWLWRKEEDQF